jgi:hypothetical protein
VPRSCASSGHRARHCVTDVASSGSRPMRLGMPLTYIVWPCLLRAQFAWERPMNARGVKSVEQHSRTARGPSGRRSQPPSFHPRYLDRWLELVGKDEDRIGRYMAHQSERCLAQLRVGRTTSAQDLYDALVGSAFPRWRNSAAAFVKWIESSTHSSVRVVLGKVLHVEEAPPARREEHSPSIASWWGVRPPPVDDRTRIPALHSSSGADVMKESVAPESTLVCCPTCGAKVGAKRLAKHLRHVHGAEAPGTDSIGATGRGLPRLSSKSRSYPTGSEVIRAAKARSGVQVRRARPSPNAEMAALRASVQRRGFAEGSRVPGSNLRKIDK